MLEVWSTTLYWGKKETYGIRRWVAVLPIMYFYKGSTVSRSKFQGANQSQGFTGQEMRLSLGLKSGKDGPRRE